MTKRNARQQRPGLVYRTISFLPEDFNRLKERQRKLERQLDRRVSNSETLAGMLAESRADDRRAS